MCDFLLGVECHGERHRGGDGDQGLGLGLSWVGVYGSTGELRLLASGWLMEGGGEKGRRQRMQRSRKEGDRQIGASGEMEELVWLEKL